MKINHLRRVHLLSVFCKFQKSLWNFVKRKIGKDWIIGLEIIMSSNFPTTYELIIHFVFRATNAIFYCFPQGKTIRTITRQVIILFFLSRKSNLTMKPKDRRNITQKRNLRRTPRMPTCRLLQEPTDMYSYIIFLKIIRLY